MKASPHDIEKIQEIADEAHGNFRDDYSGRGMYGAQCLAIECDDELDVIEAAAIAGVRRPNIDSLGKGKIAYWPSMQTSEPTRTQPQ